MSQVRYALVATALCKLADVKGLEHLKKKELTLSSDIFFYSGFITTVIVESGRVRLENNQGDMLIVRPGQGNRTFDWYFHLGGRSQCSGQIIRPDTQNCVVRINGNLIFDDTGMAHIRVPRT